MADNMEVIISAIDEASEIFRSIASSCSEMMSSITGSASEASEGIDDIGIAAEEIGSSIGEINSTTIDDVSSAADEASSSADELSSSLENIDGGNLGDAASGADELGDSLGGAAGAADELSNSMAVIEGSMLLGAAEQIGSLAGNTEDMAQQMNSASIAVGQLATMTGMAEPEMVSLINNISNATFPNDEAMMYVKNLKQMGVESSNYAKSATDIDIINDAFGMGAQATNSLATEMSVLGVNMNDVSSSFNALAYANANTKGGMDNFFAFLRKYDADLHDMGYDMDQTAVIIAGATQKFGGGKAALSGLSNALKEADGDSRKLEEALGLQAGALDNATELTAQYEGVTQQLASEESEHKTILDQVGAAWEDVSLSLSGVLSPAASAISAIGEVGSLGMSIKGIKELSTTFTQLKETKYGMAAANYVQAASEGVLSAATAAYGTVVAVLTGEIGLAEAATMAWNAVLAMNPLVLVAVAAVALAVAVYEVGKAFGWWTDVGSMLDAIWAGIQRLWSAFINHPDVQAFINNLKLAWSNLQIALTPVINAVLKFFNVQQGGEFDIVRALIDGVSMAWNAMKQRVMLVINVIKLTVKTIQKWYLETKARVELVKALFRALPNWIRGAISSLVKIITKPFKDAYTGVKGKIDDIKNYVSGIPGAVSGALSGLASTITKPFTDAYTRIAKEVENIKAKAREIPVIGGAFGGPELAYGGLDLLDTTQTIQTNDNRSWNLNHDLNITLDLKHVPSNIDESTLRSALVEGLTSKEVLNVLVNNDDFQSFDSKAKARISARNKRARGV